MYSYILPSDASLRLASRLHSYGMLVCVGCTFSTERYKPTACKTGK
ncbi:MAG: hypothetical protein LBQ66_08700 [Planctomycetaceae bacterium]|nr:hypothetical protein [Planctomycetaceae bacterium]